MQNQENDLTANTSFVCERIAPVVLPSPSSEAAKLGLRYERSVGKRLSNLALYINGTLEHNPWFRYRDLLSSEPEKLKLACPDFIFLYENKIIVIECKLTYVRDAEQKLIDVYIPIVRAAFPLIPRAMIRGLVITKNLTPEARTVPYIRRLYTVFQQSYAQVPVLLWRGHETIKW